MRRFSGLKVLVVEDEGMVALMIEDMLHDLGFKVVASVSRLADARAVAAEVEADLGVLDVNLAGEPSFSVAEILRERQIPFIFSTGYGLSGLPDEFADQPLVGKPFSTSELQQTIEAALSR
ncbi:DNA-binding response OmpR family regulator [Rhizobium sp. BK650]|uniref:response regulator n=1 Tax=Rhizobium sp. BK650 TaxID=2586990 RepID=UPI00161CB54C|nr:response regulator [Rhizobium sp. BK650]MBB3656638.1 DNA-binding response OmpR family regulator [Rhizobium sp. BK650]